MSGNRYGVDTGYFKKKLELIIRDLEHYKPAELLSEFGKLMDVVRPIDACASCKKQSLVVFDDDSNECLQCQNIQNVKGT